MTSHASLVGAALLVCVAVGCEREGVTCDGDTVLDADGRPVEVCRAPERCGQGGDGQAECAPPVGDGELCESEVSTSVCAEGLLCLETEPEISMCFRPRDQGQSCAVDEDFEAPCRGGLLCNGTGGEGTCEAQCEVDADCRPDQRCAVSECGGVCGTALGRGEPCAMFAQAPDPTDGSLIQCGRTRACVEGLVCTATPEGERCELPCSTDADCAADEVCHVDECGAVCAPPAGLGDYCRFGRQRADGTTCTSERRCAPGLECSIEDPGLCSE